MSDFERKATELLGHLVYSHNWVREDVKHRAHKLLADLETAARGEARDTPLQQRASGDGGGND